MIEKTIEVERMEHVISVFGSFDQNLRIIESELGVKVLDRENMIHICGEEESVMLAEKAINGLLTLAAKGENIDAQNVRYILKLVSEGKETKIQELAGDVICITSCLLFIPLFFLPSHGTNVIMSLRYMYVMDFRQVTCQKVQNNCERFIFYG